MKELVNSISQSPTLTAKILRLANSAYYSLPKRITRLTQAVNLLGLKTVRNLALSIFTVENFFLIKSILFLTPTIFGSIL